MAKRLALKVYYDRTTNATTIEAAQGFSEEGALKRADVMKDAVIAVKDLYDSSVKDWEAETEAKRAQFALPAPA